MYKHVQLLHDIEKLIEGGQLKAGDKLPSIRELALQSKHSKSTVIRTMDELEKRHRIYSIPRSGYYVVKSASTYREEVNKVIDFATSAPDPNVFPYLDFQHCINTAIDTYRNDLFIYGTAKGLPSLITEVQKQLTNYQVFAKESNIVITSGVQQALSLLAVIPFPNNKSNILIEQPGYHLLNEYLQLHQIPVIGIQRNAEGIDLQQLEAIFRTGDIKFFYTMPRFHNPLGTSYTNGLKKRIAKLAEKYDVYIVEDDYLADLDQDLKSDPIYAYDLYSRVVYLKSYSKIIFPGLRIGVAVIPDALADVFISYKKLHDIDSSMLSQAALEIYLKSGMFERHKQKLSNSYRRRSEILFASLRQQSERSNGILVHNHIEQPCIHTHIVLDKRISIPHLITQLKKQSIWIDGIDKNYLSFFERGNILKLNISNTKDNDIEHGIQRIADVLRRK